MSPAVRRRCCPSPSPAAATALLLVACVLAGGVATAAEVARTRDGERWLVSRADWLITYDAIRGTVSGSVAGAGGESVLIDCDITGTTADEFRLACFSAVGTGWQYLASRPAAAPRALEPASWAWFGVSRWRLPVDLGK